MPDQITGFKIVEQADDGSLRTLFHGIFGSRKLAEGKWIENDDRGGRQVRDGSSKTTYVPGLHVMRTLEDAIQYGTSFTKRREKLRIVRCEASGLREKSHSRAPIVLADRIRIDPSILWSIDGWRVVRTRR